MSTAGNPYQPPQASLTPLATLAGDLVPAGKWRRFFNWLIDRCALYGLTTFLLMVLALADGPHWLGWYEHLGFWRQLPIQMVLMLAYYVALEGRFGVSLGKLVTGTRVIDEYGRPPTPVQAFVRTLARWIPFDPLSVAFSEDGKARGWHDSLARTYVVRRRR